LLFFIGMQLLPIYAVTPIVCIPLKVYRTLRVQAAKMRHGASIKNMRKAVASSSADTVTRD
jgi:hypothetical protein